MNDGAYDITLMRLTFRSLRWSMTLTNPLMSLQDALMFGEPSVLILHFRQRIRITATPSNLGVGNRPWLECPECDSRCQVLWCRDDLGYAACRHCTKLRYASKNLKVRSFKEYVLQFVQRSRIRTVDT